MPNVDLEGLQDFADAGDREAPPHFAGRRGVQDDIKNAATRCWNRWQNGQNKTPGATRVVSGAPGAGKSSLLMHLEREWAKTGAGAPLMLRLGDPADFMNGTAFAERLADLLSPGKGAQIRTDLAKTWSLQAGGAGIGGQVGRESRIAAPDDPINAVLSEVSVEKWKGPVVVAIDEFQATTGDEGSLHAMVLRKLHAQDYAAPVMAVLAGLSDTLDAVDRLGVSRRAIESHHALGGFSETEAQDLVAGWGGSYGLPPGGDWEDVMLDEARRGSCWPAHVRNALAALADEVVRVEGDMRRVNMEPVRRRARERRREYYTGRMSSEMWQSDLLLGAVARDFRDGMRLGDVIDLIEKHDDPSGSRRHRLPKNLDADDYCRHLVHRGVLQADRGAVTTAIPSLRSWIIQTCVEAPTAKSTAEDGASAFSRQPEPSAFDDPTDPFAP